MVRGTRTTMGEDRHPPLASRSSLGITLKLWHVSDHFFLAALSIDQRRFEYAKGSSFSCGLDQKISWPHRVVRFAFQMEIRAGSPQRKLNCHIMKRPKVHCVVTLVAKDSLLCVLLE